jgi:hypothetical protein
MHRIVPLSFLSLIFLLAGGASPLAAQGSLRSYELGLRFSSLNQFGAMCKVQREDQRWRRYRLLAGSAFAQVNSNSVWIADLSFRLATGTERRRPLADKLSFLHGWEWNAGFGFQSGTDLTRITLSPGLNYVLGLQYACSPRLVASLETLPGAYLDASWDLSGEFFALNFGSTVNLSAVSAVLLYRFDFARP